MTCKALVMLASCALASGGFVASAGAQQASVSSDAAAKGAPATGATGTTDVFAFSQTGGTKNGISFYDLLKAGGTIDTRNGCTVAGPLQCPSPAPPPWAPGLVTAIRVDAKPLFSPAVGARGQPKPVAPVVTQSVESLTAGALGVGQYQSRTGMVVAKGTALLDNQRAAGAAFDPFTISGPSTFPNYQYALDASLQAAKPGDWAGITYFAVDSRLTTPADATGVNGFFGPTELFDQALWSLSIVENGPLTSLSDLADPSKLAIAFVVNPAAISMGILTVKNSLGNAYTAVGLDAAIDSAVRGDFTLVGGAATLSSYDLFPSMPTLDDPTPPLLGSTVYTVSGSVTYGDAVNAGVFTVPEPSTWAIMLVGFAGLGFAGYRRARVGHARLAA